MDGQTETVEVSEVTEDITSLTDLFNDDEVETVAEVEKPEVAEKTETEKVEAEKPTEETTKVEETEKVETTATEQESGQMAALIAERRKRQEAENKLKEYEKEKVVVPDPIDDPEGYADHIKQDNQTAILDTRITMSRDLMIDSTPDYTEKEVVFMGLVINQEGEVINPGLLQQFQESKNPARFAYKQAEEHLEIQKLKDPKYRENLEAELRLKILKELEAETSKPDTLTATEVPDLTTATASVKNSEVIETDYDNPADMFTDDEL